MRSAGACIFLAVLFFLMPTVAFAVVDTDGDGLSDEQEALHYTDPNNPDTDGDGYSDGVEVEKGYSPLMASSTRMHESDYDGDGLNDWLEGWFGSDRGKKDTDADGHSDFDEVMRGFSPTNVTTTQFFGGSRRIVVDRSTQHLGYFVDGVKILNFPVSTGNPGSETPGGSYAIQRMIANKRYVGPGYDLANVLWNMQFKPMYYLHGAYWHNDFGIKTHSHGCVNLRDTDAAFLFTYMDVGVPVDIVGVTPKGFFVGT